MLIHVKLAKLKLYLVRLEKVGKAVYNYGQTAASNLYLGFEFESNLHNIPIRWARTEIILCRCFGIWNWKRNV